MFTAKVYRIMVGSLSGAVEEVYIAKEIIRKWNQQNAECTGKVFMPIEWSSEPAIIQNVDVVVGIIDNWLDNPKIIENSIEACKKVMLFFKAINNPANTIFGELEEVQSFKKRNDFQCFWADYYQLTDLCTLLYDQLEEY